MECLYCLELSDVPEGTEIMFPNVKGVIDSFDYTQKKLVVTKEKFREVCDYEN